MSGDDIDAMRRAVNDLRTWLHRQQHDPEMTIAVLVAVLSEFAVANRVKLVTLAEQLLLSGGDFHDAWARGLERDVAAGRIGAGGR